MPNRIRMAAILAVIAPLVLLLSLRIQKRRTPRRLRRALSQNEFPQFSMQLGTEYVALEIRTPTGKP